MTYFIFLAAGRGSRLKEMTDEQTKGMLEIEGRSLLLRQLDMVVDLGRISIVTGYLSNRIFEHVSKEYKSPCFHQNRHWAKTNMVYSMLKADPYIMKGHDIVILYTDILYKKEIMEKMLASNSPICLPSFTGWRKQWENRYDNPLSDLETFKLNPDGSLKEIGGKPTSYDDIEGQFMGMIKFTWPAWIEMHEMLRDVDSKVIETMDSTTLLNMLIKYGVNIVPMPVDDGWFEIDTERDLEYAKKYAKDII